MKSNLYGVVTGYDEDGNIRRTSRTAEDRVRAEVATDNSTLALEVSKTGEFRVLHCPRTWSKAQADGPWTVVASGHVGSNSIEVNHA